MKMLNKFKGLMKEEHGQGMTEYGLVLGLIAVGVVGTLVLMRKQIVSLFEKVLTSLQL
jgi:pilus assembly protein Flp/PilA